MTMRILASILFLSCGAAAFDDESAMLQVAADPTSQMLDQAEKFAAGHMGKLDVNALMAAIPKGVEVAQQLAEGLGLNIDMSKISQMSAMAAPMAPMAAMMVQGPDGKLDMSKVAGIMKPVAEMAQAMGPEKIAEMVLGQAGYELDDNSRKMLGSLKNVDLKNIDVMKYMGMASNAVQGLPKALPIVTSAVQGMQKSSIESKNRMLMAMKSDRSSAHMAQLADQSMETALIAGNHVFSAAFTAARMIMPQLIKAGVINKQDKSILKSMTHVHEDLMNGISVVRERVNMLDSAQDWGTDLHSYRERQELVGQTSAYARSEAHKLKKKCRTLFSQLNTLLDQFIFVVPEQQLKMLKLEKPVRQLLDDYYPNEPEAKETLTNWFNEEIKVQSELVEEAIDNFLDAAISSLDYKQDNKHQAQM